MKNLITYLKTLWSWVADSQSTDVSLDCRLTVGSPSGFNSKLMLKLVSVLVILLTIGSGNVWGVVNGDLFERISAVPSANDEVIFVNQASTYACGTTDNGNNRTPVSITTSSNQYIYNSSNNVQVFVVKTASSKYGFHTGSGYIYSKSSSKNQLGTNSTAASTAPSGTELWSMSCSSSNVWSVTNGKNTSYYLAFNGTDYFAQYKSGQSKPYIYKKVMSAPTAVAASSITSSGATITVTDATNVNNYELYYSTSSTPPTAGSSATTTITGGKSKALTGLTASTTYYVWARAFSTSPARKTGWVALTGSTFTTTAGSCTAPSSVSVAATSVAGNYGYRYTTGETIKLTATATGGSGGSYTYQWQKYSGTWDDLDGKTSQNLEISNCTASDGGQYRCVVSTGATCSTASDGYNVRVWTLNGNYSGSGFTENAITWTGETTGTVTLSLNANSTYEFKVYGNGDAKYYGCNSGISVDADSWTFRTSDGNCSLSTGAIGAGDYTFAINIANANDNYIAVSVTYPRKTIYVVPNGYTDASAKLSIYYWRSSTNGWSGFLTTGTCTGGKYYTEIPGWAQSFSIVRLNSDASVGTWDKKWNQTADITASASYDQYTVNTWCSGDGCKEGTTAGAFATPTYTISFAGGTGATGSTDSHTGIVCNTNQTLRANNFSKTGYTFAGWKANVDVKVGGETVSAGTVIAGGAIIQNVTSDITLTAQWSEILHNITVAYKCGETTVKSSTTINNVGIATTGSTTSPDITGYTWSTWSAMPDGVTTSTTPLTTRAITINATADSKTITANYIANVYNITYKDQGNVAYSGNNAGSLPATHTYGTATALVNGTKTGYTFGGWYTDASCTVSAGSSIGATAKTADFTLYAKWTATNYSITYNGLEGATNSNPANYTIESSAITLVDPGTRDGYTFAGWYTNEGKTSPVSTPAIAAGSTGNKTFWAKWDRNYYTITWHVGDATDTSEDVEHGTLFSALDPENDAPAHGDGALSACGSTKFIGWVKASGAYTDDGKTVDWYNTHKANASDAITGDTHYYAMYAEAEGAEIYSRVTSDLGATNWAGDYLIAYSSTKFADGRTGGTSGMGASGAVVNPDTKLGTLVDTVNLAWGNTYNVTLELIDNSTNTYVLKTKDGQYNYQSSNSNGLLSTATKATAANYPISVTFTSSSDIKLALGGGAAGAVFRYNTSSSGYFRYYKDGGQSAVYLYKKTQNLTNYRTGCSVSCAMPTSLTSGSITKTGATISWTGGGTGTLVRYEYAYWEDGTDEPTSGFENNSTNTSATLSGLYSGVKYNWKVRKVCTGDDNSRWAYSYFTTLNATLTYSVPTGVTAVTTPATTAGDLESADVPTDCGECWVFAGWTTAAIATPTSDAPAALFPAGTKAKVSGDKQLHAVYKKVRYQLIDETTDLEDDADYVLTILYNSHEYALTATAGSGANYAASTDVTSQVRENNDGYFVYNPNATNIWKFTGTAASGRLYNATNAKYVDLSATPVLKDATSDNLAFTNPDPEDAAFNIASTTTSSNKLYMWTDLDWGISSTAATVYMYQYESSSYATTPDCPKYTVTWDVNNGATTSTSNVTKCAGYLASLPDAPANNTLSSCQTNGKFMGWSPTKVMPAQDVVPTSMFSEVEYSPEITQDITFYAVFAEEHSGSTGATNRTYTFTSASWGDDEGAWDSGAAGNWNSSAVQVTKNKTGANATTISSYNAVTKVTVTYFTNASSGAGSIDIKVNGTSYTGGASVTNSGGTTPRTIDFTPPSSALDGAVKITVTCSDNSIYIKSVQIFYTGSTTTYDQYRTACCTDPQLKFLDGEGDPTTEYVIVREDLASASTPVEIDCDISSLNTTGAITWTSTHRDKNDYASAYTWSSSQPTDRLEIDLEYNKIIAKETGVWQITISQAGATTYCPEDATVTVRVKTVDKFIDAVNGNFSGEPQSLEDTGNGILLPTEAMFSTNNGCSTTRRLIGWIKASDLATTYASSRRVNMIDDLKTGDASNKVIAPGTKVQATGVTWYAVWGVEK